MIRMLIIGYSFGIRCEVFRHLFETVLQRCMKDGLVGGEGFAIDASIVKADVRRQHAVPGSQDVDLGNPAAAK
jgi:hypothetical protein